MLLGVLLAAALSLTPCLARPHPIQSYEQPYTQAYSSRTKHSRNNGSLIIDLGYEIYQGVGNPSTGINSWKGIRFAAPPTGANRWQAPKIPETNRSAIILADSYATRCPQTNSSKGAPFEDGVTGDEDCLFLNVDAPANPRGPLPVLVWVHGGGYGQLDGHQEFTTIINANNNGFIGVSIEYRLGAFGFLSSQEVSDKGVVNAGLRDQFLALQWVQQYIELFGGDPTRVTLSGESAGGGSVMLLDMAYGGTVGNALFQNTIAASPFLPMQQEYNAAGPTSSYNAFVERTGCSSYPGSKFDCLAAASTEVLQNASTYVSTSSPFGLWAFLPVTDGVFIQDLPSRQLLAKKVNGQRMLTGNNAIEGSLFVPPNITTESDVADWLELTFPMLTDTDIQTVLAQYPIDDPSITATSPRFATNGLTNPNANEVSPEGAGQIQRAFNIYGETTFVCPSYWLAEAYSSRGSAAYKYQYSVIPGTHGQDVAAYFNPPATPHSPDFSTAFKQIWGNFIMANNPSISSLVANGQSTGNTTANPASDWPAYNLNDWPMINLNESFTSTVVNNGQIEPSDGIVNSISLVNAYTWEAGRGSRCDFWRSIAVRVPEK